jgi:putative addiction module killer protein
MLEVRTTEVFDKWLKGLRDHAGKAKITARIRRLGQGNPGDVKPVSGGISEMRIHSGPGYRVYYKPIGDVVIMILCGGDKSTQASDIEQAKKLLREL